jgi:hypothetical protein
MVPISATASSRLRTELEASRPDVESLSNHAARIASGMLASAMVHEFANLLTVIDGLSQVGELGISFAEGQEMMQPPASRCHSLVDAYRHFFTERISSHPSPVVVDMRQFEILLRARLRGRGTAIDLRGGDCVIDPTRAHALRLVFVLASLAILEEGRRIDRWPQRIEFSTDRVVDGHLLRARFVALTAPERVEEPLISLAARLASAAGGVLAISRGAVATELHLSLGPELD